MVIADYDIETALTALQIAELLLHHREKSRLVYQATMGWGFLGCSDTLPQASLEQGWLRLVAAKVFLRGLDLVQQIVFRRWRFELQPSLETHADSGLALWSLKDDIRIAKICLLRGAVVRLEQAAPSWTLWRRGPCGEKRAARPADRTAQLGNVLPSSHT